MLCVRSNAFIVFISLIQNDRQTEVRVERRTDIQQTLTACLMVARCKQHYSEQIANRNGKDLSLDFSNSLLALRVEECCARVSFLRSKLIKRNEGKLKITTNILLTIKEK